MKKWLYPLLMIVLFFCGCAKKQEVVFVKEMPEAFVSAAMDATCPPETTVPSATLATAEPEMLTALINPKDEDFVRVKNYIPTAVVELKYATVDNFTGQVIYDFEDVFLRYGTVMKLKSVSQELEEQGLYLKIWDGFRPVSAQFRLWEICPDSTYVANPNKGFSNHSRGFAVDLTLVDSEGREVEMPTGFDDFSAKADRDYSDCSETSAINARFLESIMEKHGFSGYWGEWWHFNDNQKYDVESCFDPALISRQKTKLETPLLENYWDSESAILMIPEKENLTLLGYIEGYAMVEYWGYRGYIAMEAMH